MNDPANLAANPGYLVPAQPDKLIRLAEVCELTSLGKTTIYAMPDFPRRVRIHRRAVGWKLSEVQAWIKSRQLAGK